MIIVSYIPSIITITISTTPSTTPVIIPLCPPVVGTIVTLGCAIEYMSPGTHNTAGVSHSNVWID